MKIRTIRWYCSRRNRFGNNGEFCYEIRHCTQVDTSHTRVHQNITTQRDAAPAERDLNARFIWSFQSRHRADLALVYYSFSHLIRWAIKILLLTDNVKHIRLSVHGWMCDRDNDQTQGSIVTKVCTLFIGGEKSQSCWTNQSFEHVQNGGRFKKNSTSWTANIAGKQSHQRNAEKGYQKIF